MYGQPEKRPRTYASVTMPVLVLLAGADEHADRPAEKMAAWFAEHSHSRNFASHVVPKVNHGFKGGEEEVALAVRQWILA